MSQRVLGRQGGSIPPPLTPPQGGEVLAAGRARGQAPQGVARPKPLSVKVRRATSRVRFAGLRPPLTKPSAPGWKSGLPTRNSIEAVFRYTFGLVWSRTPQFRFKKLAA